MRLEVVGVFVWRMVKWCIWGVTLIAIAIGLLLAIGVLEVEFGESAEEVGQRELELLTQSDAEVLFFGSSDLCLL